MSADDKTFKMGLDRLNALFMWWGVPDTNTHDKITDQMRRLQSLVAELQKAHSEAYSRQLETLFNVSERVAGSLQEFVHCRQPEQVIGAGSNVLLTLFEGASQQAQSWLDLTQKIQECCAEITREAAAETGTPASASVAAPRPVKAAEHTIQPVKAESEPTRSSNTTAAATRPAKAAVDPAA